MINAFIPLDSTVEKLIELVDDTNRGYVTYVRASMATGKTTLAKHLAREYSDKFVLVPHVHQGNGHREVYSRRLWL